jgi:PncC family amidohydrolase
MGLKNIFEEKIITEIGEILSSRHETVAVAESVTSGYLQAAFSQMKEAMNIFHGGMTVYNIGQKTRHLRVNPIEAQQTNCVSETVTGQMASEISYQFLADWGIACTGYASPVPELNIQETFALYSFFNNRTIVTNGRISGSGKSQYDEQIHFANEILNRFAEHLVKFHDRR